MTQPNNTISASHIWKRFPLAAGSLFAVWLGRTKKHASFEALRDVSIHVPRGEMVGVLGRNGAGKSTLLRTLSGVYSADSGSIKVDGDIAGLFELGGFGNNHLTGRDYAARYLTLNGVPHAKQATLIDEIHDFSELGIYYDQKVQTYSAGMTARLYFAAATAVKRDIYLVDEILSVGDEHFLVKSWARMRGLLAHGASGVLVTHDWSAVIKLCRSAYVLERGEVVQQGRADAVVAAYLKIPAPTATRAEIIPAAQYNATSGKPIDLTCEVVLHEDIAAQLAISIEYLILGVGWEIITISEFEPVGDIKGHYNVTISLPETILRAGDYMLNMFLCTKPDAHGKRETLHGFSWTYGNGLTLHVGGEAGSDIAPFPIAWQQVTA